MHKLVQTHPTSSVIKIFLLNKSLRDRKIHLSFGASPIQKSGKSACARSSLAHYARNSKNASAWVFASVEAHRRAWKKATFVIRSHSGNASSALRERKGRREIQSRGARKEDIMLMCRLLILSFVLQGTTCERDCLRERNFPLGSDGDIAAVERRCKNIDRHVSETIREGFEHELRV